MTKNINDVIDFAANKAECEHSTVPVELVTAGVAGIRLQRLILSL